MSTSTTQPFPLETILRRLREHRDELFARYPLRAMAVFGSVSRGDSRPDSDVDIMVEFERPVGLDFVRLSYDLEELLGVKVDLVSRKSIKDRYFKYIEPDLKYV